MKLNLAVAHRLLYICIYIMWCNIIIVIHMCIYLYIYIYIWYCICIYIYICGVISKILYPESVANALSLRIYRTPPCKFNCPSRPKIQKNNMWIIDFDQNSAHVSSAKLFYSELLEQLGLLAMQAPWPMPSYLYLPTQELAMFAVCRFYEFVSGRLCVSAGFI